MSKYKVEFGFSHEEVGYEIIDFCEKNINIKNDSEEIFRLN